MFRSGQRKRVTVSRRSGLIFPVSRIHRAIKSLPNVPNRVSKGASIYLTAIVEYLTAELLELAGNAAKDCRRTRISPRHILLGYAHDEELNKVLRNCVLPQGGVLPNIHSVLFPAITTQTKKQATAIVRKPTLTKKGQGSFTVLGAPTSKAAAVKGTNVTTLSERVLIRGQKLTVVQGSIVNIQADAIVHPTNNSFYMGGDVGKALAKAGGQQLRDAVADAGRNSAIANYGDVTISTAPNLTASHLIHVHSPKWNAETQDQCIGDLDRATLNILTLADQQGLKSVAVPSISSGHAGFPKQTAAQTILAALSKYFRQTATTNLEQVFFVLYDAESVNVYTTELQQTEEMTEDTSRSTELEDLFFLHANSTKQYLVKLSPTAISIAPHGAQQRNQTRFITIDDVYGCLCMKSRKNAIQCHLTLYLYTTRKTRVCNTPITKQEKLRRLRQILTYGKFNDFESNLNEMTKWHDCVTNAIYLRRNLPRDIVMTKRDKRALVFVNPASGSGKAYRLVMEHVIGVWSESEFNHHIVITEYAGHARDYVKTIQLADWSGIILASGDGLVFEVINGLMSRPDWQEALRLPIGHIPGGSGNAFITNIIRYSKQPIMSAMKQFVAQAAVLVATHQVIPFDLSVIHTCDEQRLFSFLCVEWGIIADVDCDSEKYRFLGETRFTVEAIKRILHPRVYHGYIDYIPYEDSDTIVDFNQISTHATTTDFHRDLLPLNEVIPTDSTTTKWRRINGPFAHVLITSKALISKDVVASAVSTLSDGYLTLQFIRSDGPTRKNLAKTFTKISDGSHFDYNFVEWMRIRAFRLVPNDTNGNLMVDGEKVAYGPIQGEILPGIGRCMGKLPNTDRTSIDI
ncbi:unnamed protein product [Adineta ricciae]|uniref:Histone H2A n=1 Tax=Adineta ricciae TaxID=249248 RepID=A0A813N3H3_ADIRI|nr:unnamed protein product [Adineta ricciae]